MYKTKKHLDSTAREPPTLLINSKQLTRQKAWILARTCNTYSA